MQDLRSPMGFSITAEIRAHPGFALLVRSRNRLACRLTALMLLIYFGFIGLVAFAPGLMAMPVSSTITLGFPLGLGVILAAIGLTGLYVLRANASFDRLTRRIVQDAA